MTTTETTFRTIARCKSCKAAVVAETTEYRSESHRFSAPVWAVCSCGAHVQTFAVRGKVTTKKCGPGCTHALGASCSCECGGENHGEGWVL